MKTSREKAIEKLQSMQNYGIYNKGFEFKPEKKVWFCVVYGNTRKSAEKELIERLFNGEKVIDNKGENMKMVFGYGKLLGINTEYTYHRCNNKKLVRQYIIYDCVILFGEGRVHVYDTFHEGWIKLGQWAKDKFRLKLGREKVVFT